MTTSAFPHRYLKAAEQGNASGEYALALMYRDGDGVGQNHAEAARWFRKAASHGQPDAARNLAEAYRKGLGVPRDEAAAQKWQRKFDENFRSSSEGTEGAKAGTHRTHAGAIGHRFPHSSGETAAGWLI